MRKSIAAQCTKQVIGKGLVIIEKNCMVSRSEVALLDHESYKSFSNRKSFKGKILSIFGKLLYKNEIFISKLLLQFFR